MQTKSHNDYFDFGKIENEKFWRRLGGKPGFKDKSVLDFGCGHGALCVDIAQDKVKSITGIDLEDELLNFANDNLKENYQNFVDIIQFEKKDILKDDIQQKYDFIVSKDTFEHTLNLPKVLDKMYDLLNLGGKVKVYDPKAMNNCKEKYFPNEKNIIYCQDKYDVLENSEALILLTEWPEFRSPDFKYIKSKLIQPVIFDGKNQYDKKIVEKIGFFYYSI